MDHHGNAAALNHQGGPSLADEFVEGDGLIGIVTRVWSNLDDLIGLAVLLSRRMRGLNGDDIYVRWPRPSRFEAWLAGGCYIYHQPRCGMSSHPRFLSRIHSREHWHPDALDWRSYTPLLLSQHGCDHEQRLRCIATTTHCD